MRRLLETSRVSGASREIQTCTIFFFFFFFFCESARNFWPPESPRLICRSSRGNVSASEIGPLIERIPIVREVFVFVFCSLESITSGLTLPLGSSRRTESQLLYLRNEFQIPSDLFRRLQQPLEEWYNL